MDTPACSLVAVVEDGKKARLVGVQRTIGEEAVDSRHQIYFIFCSCSSESRALRPGTEQRVPGDHGRFQNDHGACEFWVTASSGGEQPK